MHVIFTCFVAVQGLGCNTSTQFSIVLLMYRADSRDSKYLKTNMKGQCCDGLEHRRDMDFLVSVCIATNACELYIT